MDTITKEELLAEIGRLRSEAEVLKEEIGILKGQAGRRTSKATAVRSQRSAAIDSLVFETAVQTTSASHNMLSATIEELAYWTNFPNGRKLPYCVAMELNRQGVAAPRGGRWTSSQVKRSIQRGCQRMDAQQPKPGDSA